MLRCKETLVTPLYRPINILYLYPTSTCRVEVVSTLHTLFRTSMSSTTFGTLIKLSYHLTVFMLSLDIRDRIPLESHYIYLRLSNHHVLLVTLTAFSTRFGYKKRYKHGVAILNYTRHQLDLSNCAPLYIYSHLTLVNSCLMQLATITALRSDMNTVTLVDILH